MMRINAMNIEAGSTSLEQTRHDYEREYERARQQIDQMNRFREHERQLEMMRIMYSTPSYRIEFSPMLPDDKGYILDNVIYVPESRAYKFIFMNNKVDETTVGFAISHAISKVHRFIDNYKA